MFSLNHHRKEVDKMILFMCEIGSAHVITWALNREDAKRKANVWLGGNTDQYIVTPLTSPGDRIHISINLRV
jgi:hypothetical protein